MKRGEIWTLRDDNYASKARPVVIVQNDEYNDFDSIILCLFTSFEAEGRDTRVMIKPTEKNGLIKKSYVMTDKIVTVKKSMLHEAIGELTKAEMEEISSKLKDILGL